jgi:filamentous hemagglutinin
MAQQLIGVGTAPNDGQGNPIRTAFIKCNDNFSELYARAQVSPPPTLVGSIGDLAGWYASDSSYFYYCFADYDGSSIIWAQVSQIGNVSLSSISSGTSNVQLTDVNGNAAVSVAGVSNVTVFTTTGQLVTGVISATGNITGNYILGNGSLLSGLPETYSNANVAAYLLTNTGNIAAGNVLVTSAVSATGNVTGGNLLSAGMISTSGNLMSQGFISASGNIETAGYFVGTFVGNVTGNFVVPGSNTQVIFNTDGNAAATAGMTFDTNGPNLFTVLGTISSQGNVVAGNITTAGVITATGNVTGGNVLTAGLISATGNVRGGNFNTSGLITATGNVTGGNILTAGVISATGNIRTAGSVTATGNVSGGNVLVTDDIQAGGNVSATMHTGTSVSVTGNVTGGNIRTAGIITATGNITGNYFIGNGSQLSGIDATSIQNGNSNVRIASSNGNVTVNVTGVSPLAIFANIGLLVGGVISAGGNIVGGNLIQGTTRVYKWTTQANTAPLNAVAGDEWYDSYTDKLYKYINDGIGSQWVDQSFPSTFGTLAVTGAATIGGTLAVTGNISSGNFATIGSFSVSSITKTGSNAVGNIGSASNYFNTVFAQATSAQYADLAEHYAADAEYVPGTVVVFGGESEITVSDISHDTRVAGVVSSQPAYVMNAKNPGTVVALAGRVPCRVQGPVSKGDRLINKTSGTAGRFDPALGELGCIIGKSLEDISDDRVALIEISVGRT